MPVTWALAVPTAHADASGRPIGLAGVTSTLGAYDIHRRDCARSPLHPVWWRVNTIGVDTMHGGAFGVDPVHVGTVHVPIMRHLQRACKGRLRGSWRRGCNSCRSCWIPGSWMCRCRTTQLLSPYSPGIPYFSMVLKIGCASRTLLEYKTPESNKSAPVITGSVKNRIGDSQLTIECLRCYKPREIERHALPRAQCRPEAPSTQSV